MKYILITIAILVGHFASAQKYITKTGLTTFKASVDTFETVEAKNESTTALLNTETGEIATLLFVKAFHFEIALMEEHFNENYMDSDKFPKATFKGKIIEFDKEKLLETERSFVLKGALTIRGKVKQIETDVQIKKINNDIIISSEFTVTPQDFDIEISKIVRKKIAESIQLKLCYELIKKK